MSFRAIIFSVENKTNRQGDEWLSQQIYSRYGEIKRARGPFLYTEKGVRLTDLYLDDGRALLGWDGGKARLAFKNTLERGQTGSFATHHFHALERSVLELFGSFDFVKVCHESEVAQKLPRWFPWMSDVSKAESFYFVPPFPFACDYVLVVGRKDCILLDSTPRTNCLSENTCFRADFTAENSVNPSLLAAFTRSIYDLKAALQNRSEEDFRFFDRSLEKYFTREGPYLFVRPEIIAPKIIAPEIIAGARYGGGEESNENKVKSAEYDKNTDKCGENWEYKNFVLFCLDNGVVISPNPQIPSIIPFGADYGVFRKLSKSIFIIGGKK